MKVGRKKLPKDKKKIQVTFLLDPKLKRKVDEISKNRKSMSSFLERLVVFCFDYGIEKIDLMNNNIRK